MQNLGIRIPANGDQPMEEFIYTDDLEGIYRAVGREGVDFATFPEHQVQLAFDDMGLMRDPVPKINERAMRLWATLSGQPMAAFRQPLVGDYAVLGMTISGEYFDAPSVDVVAAWIRQAR